MCETLGNTCKLIKTTPLVFPNHTNNQKKIYCVWSSLLPNHFKEKIIWTYYMKIQMIIYLYF